jgi:hypothetical protein
METELDTRARKPMRISSGDPRIGQLLVLPAAEATGILEAMDRNGCHLLEKPVHTGFSFFSDSGHVLS